MKFTFQALTATTILAAASALENGVLLSETFGGPHGTKYSDLDLVEPGQTVQSIIVRAGERVNGIGITFTATSGQQTTIYHGGRGGDENVLTLGAGEYVTGIEAHWGEKGDHTRIKYLELTTNLNNTIKGGNPTKEIGKDSAPEGYQLGGFIGTSGKELDSTGAIWTSITPVE
ncbi:hypothetical protein PHMEG_00039891 [Phytophthora megakarya]|uniref:Jacalin-type lectin domain-containing protein n=1 Tax=Phytophthora megakarya TaxID=4795 RepID=A0A225UE49_9STRA|nr:hypothetical protein PHMEG_00039891 [Phytophthora megakarya]